MPQIPVEFRTIVELSEQAIWVIDENQRIRYWNPRACRWLGCGLADAVGRHVLDFFLEEDRADMAARLRRRCAGESEQYLHRLKRQDGVVVWGLITAHPRMDEHGKFGGSVVVIADVTAMKAQEQAAQRLADRYRMIADHVVDVVWMLDPRTRRFTYVSPSVELLRGWTAEEVMAQPLEAALGPESMRVVAEKLQMLQALPPPAPEETANQIVELGQPHRDGRIVPTEVVVTVLRDDEGRPSEILGVSRDINERMRSEAALRESESWLRRSQRVARLGSYIFDVGSDLWTSSEMLDDLFGIGADYERSATGWLALVHPDERRAVARYLADEVLGRGCPFQRTYRIVQHSTGEVRWVHGLGQLDLDAAGRPLRLFGTIQDVTELHQQAEERQALEIRLLQAQKLESLGVLAGGIAHEFNNLLTSILGHAELALQDLPHGSPVRENIIAIDSSARRAAEISHQMLTYSGRGRFIVRRLELSSLVRGMMRMVEVSVSKRNRLAVELAEDLPEIEADEGQVRQLVLSLVTNAAEAIADRDGAIRISTWATTGDRQEPARDYHGNPLPPGPHVVLEVSDSGPGMAPETAARVFDPFFTTKFAGRGLGLPAVLGIVRGHQGAIQLDSETGRGTTIRVFLPALSEPATPSGPARVQPGAGDSAS